MWDWLSKLDVNAVLAAVVAAVLYLHNHSFRKAQGTPDPDPTPAPTPEASKL